jgi:hypothetical protein
LMIKNQTFDSILSFLELIYEEISRIVNQVIVINSMKNHSDLTFTYD